MANYTIYGYSPGAFSTTPGGQVMLDPDWDASADRIRYEITDTYGDGDGDTNRFDGDSTNDEVGDDANQSAVKYDAQGNVLSSGQVYLEESWTLTDGNGNVITLYRVEGEGGAHSGWVTDGPIIPGVAYDFAGPTNIDETNHPRYTDLHEPTEDPDQANAYQGGNNDDDLRMGAENDQAFGDDGNDSISGGDGQDDLRGDAGNDTVHGDGGNDTIYGGMGNDSLSGGTGNDLIYGGADNDSIEGGADNDTIFGEDGDDTIDGGAGDDQLDGGAGNDLIDTGGGNDTVTTGTGLDDVVFQQGGFTVVTDFDVGDDDSNGLFNDQLDVSALRTLSGNPVSSRDVVVSDDGSGNAVLTFPEGEVIVLQGVSPAFMSSASNMQAAGIPCFCAGTHIATPCGEVPVETLRPGDLVQTRDNGAQPVLWVGQRRYGSAALRSNPNLRPVHVAPGTFGNARALRLSRQHALALRHSANPAERLVRAHHLAGLRGGRVRIASGARAAHYVHILTARHEVIFAEGLAAETFYPGPWGMMALGLDAMSSLARFWPDLTRGDTEQRYGATVHPVAHRAELPARIEDLSLVV